jgi:hypothetical protein
MATENHQTTAQLINCSDEAKLCPLVREYISPYFNPAIPVKPEKMGIADVARYVQNYYKEHKESLFANYERLGMASKELLMLKKKDPGNLIDQQIIQKFFRDFSTGIQIAYDHAPWTEDVKINIAESLGPNDAGIIPHMNLVLVSADYIARYAIEQKSNTQIDSEKWGRLSSSEYTVAMGVEEGRHLSQLYQSEFQPLDTTLKPALDQFVAEAKQGTPRSVAAFTVNEKHALDKVEPQEIDALQFVTAHLEEIKAKAISSKRGALIG